MSRSFYRSADTTGRNRGRFISTIPEVERFWSKVDQDGPLPPQRSELGPCWLWLDGLNQYGYGRFSCRIAPGTERRVMAHRYAYELLIGSIPDRLTLDHLCERPACVRPGHLEPVTNSENLRRMHERRRLLNGAPT